MKKSIFYLFLILIVASCNEPPKKNINSNKPFDEEKVKEPLVQANQSSVRLEDEDIDLYVKRQNLDVTKTETGLRYQITKKGKGKLIKAKNIVSIEYKTYSIDGKLLYSSDEDGVKTFEIEKNNEIQALDEVLKCMQNGSEAHLVIPSHLAYGVAGDGNKIRQRIPIVMKIKVLNVK